MYAKQNLLLAAIALGATAIASAQDIAMGGSETYLVEAPAIVGAGGTASSANYSATISIEGPTVPLDSVSASYRMLGGPALFGAVPGNQPIVFGVKEGLGNKDGGQPVTLFGRNLTASGAGLTTASLVGQPVLGLTVLSNTIATGTTSPGINQHQNPLGGGAVSLQNGLGQNERGGAFAYTPAIVMDSLSAIDATFALSIHANLGDFLMLSYGGTVPGVAIPLFNFDGGLELLVGVIAAMPVTPLFSGDHFQMLMTLPNMPSLVGAQIPLQGLAISDLGTLSGSFTNVELLSIQ